MRRVRRYDWGEGVSVVGLVVNCAVPVGVGCEWAECARDCETSLRSSVWM